MTEPLDARVFIVEDHPVMRTVTREYLGVSPGLTVCGEAATAEEALERLDEVRPDLVLVDSSLPQASGIDFVAAVRARRADLPCIMLSGHGETGYVERALSAGARGYVLKGDPRELPGAIREVLGGGEYISMALRIAVARRRADGPPEA